MGSSARCKNHMQIIKRSHLKTVPRKYKTNCVSLRLYHNCYTLSVVVMGPLFSWVDTYGMISPASFTYKAVTKGWNTQGIKPDTVALLPIHSQHYCQNDVLPRTRVLMLQLPWKSFCCVWTLWAKSNLCESDFDFIFLLFLAILFILCFHVPVEECVGSDKPSKSWCNSPWLVVYTRNKRNNKKLSRKVRD
jgi:hypothetical protein